MTWRDWYGLCQSAINNWLGDRAPSMGAAIAYYTVFSLAPVLVLVLAVAGLAFGREAAEGALFGQLLGLVGPESAQAMQAMLKGASNQKAGIIATVLSLGALLVAATAVFAELQTALNVIWKATPPPRSGLWSLLRARLLSLSLILAIGFLLLVSLVVSAALTALSSYLATIAPGLPLLLRALHMVLSFGFITIFFGMMFKILPDAPVRWSDVWLGAAATAALFTAGKYFISLYIGSSNIASTYGAAGALVIILLWVYYSSQILLFGAEFAKAHADFRLPGRPKNLKSARIARSSARTR